MALEKVYKYRLWCNTDSKWEYALSEDGDTAPTLCPANTAHTLDGTKSSIISTLVLNEQKVRPTIREGGPSLILRGFQFSAAASSETSYTYSFTEDMKLNSAIFHADNGNFKDSIKAELMLPDLTVIWTYASGWGMGNDKTAHIDNDGITETNMNGLKLKVYYNNTGGSAIDCACNLRGAF